MAGRDGGGGFDTLSFGLLNALKTNNRHIDLFIVAFLPTFITLVTTSNEKLRLLVVRALAGFRRSPPTYERTIRIETRARAWGWASRSRSARARGAAVCGGRRGERGWSGVCIHGPPLE